MAVRLTATEADIDAEPFARASFIARTPIDIENRRAMIDRIGRLSDSLIRFGSFGIGLDGILAWVPGLGELYSVAAGGFLLLEGYRARVHPVVLAQSAVIVLARTAIDFGNVAPVLGIGSSLIVDLFRGHRWAARMLVKAIDETIYLEGPENRTSPAYLDALTRIRRGGDKKRVVFLG
ncbi:MAG TPA: DUF4112 domain-containing protein [Caulobacteraceae bacterium]|nr:DUF4112 domain-containing protein [Caulobacteraceae bacterium]